MSSENYELMEPKSRTHEAHDISAAEGRVDSFAKIFCSHDMYFVSKKLIIAY